MNYQVVQPEDVRLGVEPGPVAAHVVPHLAVDVELKEKRKAIIIIYCFLGNQLDLLKKLYYHLVVSRSCEEVRVLGEVVEDGRPVVNKAPFFKKKKKNKFVGKSNHFKNGK